MSDKLEEQLREAEAKVARIRAAIKERNERCPKEEAQGFLITAADSITPWTWRNTPTDRAFSAAGNWFPTLEAAEQEKVARKARKKLGKPFNIVEAPFDGDVRLHFHLNKWHSLTGEERKAVRE
jgi:hypothetical protein